MDTPGASVANSGGAGWAARDASERWRVARRAYLAIGPRQADESRMVWAWLWGVGRPVLFVDCEQPLVRAWCRSAPEFLADLAAFAGVPALFVDEVRRLEGAGLFVKGLVDRRSTDGTGAPTFVTGSWSSGGHQMRLPLVSVSLEAPKLGEGLGKLLLRQIGPAGLVLGAEHQGVHHPVEPCDHLVMVR